MLFAIFRWIFESFDIAGYTPVREKITLQQEIEQTEEAIRKRKTEIEVRKLSFIFIYVDLESY